jgi:16S rRNA (guanine527-N7)-methyltransferase
MGNQAVERPVVRMPANARARYFQAEGRTHVARENPRRAWSIVVLRDREAALSLIGADDATARRLSIFCEVLARWRRVTDLISENSFPDIWLRHIADSGQLLHLAPAARNWVDLGTGAGFPGMVIAIQLAGIPGARVHCIESDRRKCAFLREVARETGAPAEIHAARIESIDPLALLPVDAVTSRALAPLPRIMEFARVWIENGAIGLFPRGKTTQAQLQGLSSSIAAEIRIHRSQIDPGAEIVSARRGSRE